MLSDDRKLRIERMIDQEKSILARWAPLIEEIKSIPHLPIDLEIDLDRVRTEVAQVTDWHPHRLHANKNLPESILQHHERSFRGQCLIDYQRDPVAGMTDPRSSIHKEPDAEFDEQGRVKFGTTTLGEKMPYTVSILRSISPYVNRTRIIRTPPGGGIHWHSHHNGIYSNEYMRLCIFNFPVHTNDRVYHRVRDFRDQDAKIHPEHYVAGRIYLFNSWHDHDAWNRGNTERIAFTPYFNFADETLLRFLEPQVNRYRGPRIR